jgi:hypothetical protein
LPVTSLAPSSKALETGPFFWERHSGFHASRDRCEHLFVTSQGSAHGRFTRAIKESNLFAAELAARELRGLTLPDALELVVLIARHRPDRLERAAVRWHGRLEIEAKTLTLAESRFALAALERLPADPQAADLLRKLLRQVSPTTLRPIG